MNKEISLTDTLAGMLLTVLTEELYKKNLPLQLINNNEQLITEKESTDEYVVYTIIGSLGNKINNPDIRIELKGNAKPNIIEINESFKKLYITLYLLSIKDKN